MCWLVIVRVGKHWDVSGEVPWGTDVPTLFKCCTGAAMFRLSWLSLAVLYWVVSRFLAGPFFYGSITHTTGRLARPIVQGNCIYSRSWVRKLVNTKRHTPPHLTNPLTARVAWASQLTSQPVSSIFPCIPLPSGTWLTPGLSISWCCLPTSSFVRLVFFPLSLCLAIWFWPDLMNVGHDHTTAVYVSLRWSGGLRVVWLPAGSWHRLSHWKHGLCMRCYSILQ